MTNGARNTRKFITGYPYEFKNQIDGKNRYNQINSDGSVWGWFSQICNR